MKRSTSEKGRNVRGGRAAGRQSTGKQAGSASHSTARNREAEEYELWGEHMHLEEEEQVFPEGEESKRLALVTWEDVTAYSRVEIPNDFERYRLIKKTLGLLWAETDDYVVLVQDYDVSNRGKGYHHNDFHIIPRGIIKELRFLGEEPV